MTVHFLFSASSPNNGPFPIEHRIIHLLLFTWQTVQKHRIVISIVHHLKKESNCILYYLYNTYLNLKINHSMLIGRHSEIAVRMPNPINKLLNDESIAVQMLFLDGYTWNKPMDSMEHTINWWWLGFQWYFVIFFHEQRGGDYSYDV